MAQATTDPKDQTTTETTPRRPRRASRAGGRGPVLPAADVDAILGAMDAGEELRHKRGCPCEGDEVGGEDSRVEGHVVRAPDGTTLAVVRCVQCGEQVENPLG